MLGDTRFAHVKHEGLPDLNSVCGWRILISRSTTVAVASAKLFGPAHVAGLQSIRSGCEYPGCHSRGRCSAYRPELPRNVSHRCYTGLAHRHPAVTSRRSGWRWRTRRICLSGEIAGTLPGECGRLLFDDLA